MMMMMMNICILLLSLFTPQSEARIIKPTNKFKQFNHLEMDYPPLDLPNSKSYGVNSPFSLPPFDSLAPTSLPQNTPPNCENPPSTPTTPPMTYTPPPPSSPFVLTPIFPIQSPPQSPSESPPQTPSDNPPQSPPFTIPNPPENSPSTPNSPGFLPSPTTYIPTPPEYNVPSPTGYVSSPPIDEPSPPMNIPSPSGEFVPTPSTGYVPSPPSGYVPSPFTGYVPSPFGGYVPSPSGYGFAPSPPVFQPPVVFPPPNGPPSPSNNGSQRALWCVAKPSVPDPIIQEAMNYACGSGADCDSIQPQGTCYHPETLFAHASFAFNSYWQRTKAAGGTCDFGGTAILVTIDPSFDGCHFIAT